MFDLVKSLGLSTGIRGGLLPTGRRNRAEREAKSTQKRTNARAQRAKMKAHNKRQKRMNDRHGKKAHQK